MDDPCYSNKILFYSGVSSIDWNLTTSLTKDIDDAEKAIAFLSNAFPKDFQIYVGGMVKEEIVGNITYVHHSKLKELISQNSFRLIVVCTYLRFFELFPNFRTHKLILWANNNDLSSIGSKLTIYQILEKWTHKIDNCVCLTQWHKSEFIKYRAIYDKIVVINNGIKADFFNIDGPMNKIHNRFIYVGDPNKGLQRLLDIWKDIVHFLNKAELKIVPYKNFPNSKNDKVLIDKINSLPFIEVMPKLTLIEQYELMRSSQYWLYPSFEQDASLIIAMEMLKCKVVPLYYEYGALTEIINFNGLVINMGHEAKNILNFPEFDRDIMIANGKKYADEKCSWESRYSEWEYIIF